MARKVRRVAPQGEEKKIKVDRKTKKLFQKRAREYNSDEDEEDARHLRSSRVNEFKGRRGTFESQLSDDGEDENHGFDPEEASDDEDGRIQPGTMKFTEGINAFRLAFRKIVGKSSDVEDILGPILSAQKKLVAEKLGQEEVENKVKKEAKKEKLLICEKGHVKPEDYMNTHEKFLLGVATKGVVKLFNAVNKAQSAQKSLNPSRSKDEKVLKKRRKEAFFSELGKKSPLPAGVGASSSGGEASIWAPLRDNFMLTNPKLKDWDKIPDGKVPDEFGDRLHSDASDDDDE